MHRENAVLTLAPILGSQFSGHDNFKDMQIRILNSYPVNVLLIFTACII